jgi:Tfp pilus assembly PilM family ATPase
LQQRLGIDVAIVEPLRQLGGPGHNGQASHPACPPALSTAVGLALRGIRTYG